MVSLTQPARPRQQRKRRGRLGRALRYRLVIPLLRSRHPPGYTARGTALGIALAFTPTLGLHSLLVGALWLAASRTRRWQFSLIVAFAWTWISNPLTAVPIYYVLYLTGQVMLGRFGDLTGYADFINLWSGLTSGHHSFLEEIGLGAKLLLEDWGIAMVVGSVPWALGAGAIGYWLTLRFVRRHRKRQSARSNGA